MKILLTISFGLFSILGFTQNINGIWSGAIYGYDNEGKTVFRFPIGFDIRFDSVSNEITGYSQTLSFDSVFAECKIKGKYNKKKGFFDIRETETISSNLLPEKPSSVLNRFKIKFENVNQSEKITGKCFCLKNEQISLCWEKMKIELTRYTPSVKEADIKKE